MEKKSTGSCVSIEEVPSGNEIGILWTPAHDGALVGFALDMDKAANFRNAQDAAHAFCVRHNLGIATVVGDVTEGECVLERMHENEFINRFGGLPVAEGIFFDEGGSIGTARDIFQTDENDDLTEADNNVHAQSAMREAGRKAALESAGVIAAVAVAFGVFLAFAPSLALTFAVAVLAFLGVWHICVSVKKMTRRFYKSAAGPLLYALRFVAERKANGDGAE